VSALLLDDALLKSVVVMTVI